MEIAIYIAIGVAAGALLMFLLMNARKKGAEMSLMRSHLEEVSGLRLQLATSETQLESLREQNEKDVAALREQNEKEVFSLREQNEKEVASLREQNESEKAILREQMSSEAKLQRERFDEQLRTVQEQFQNLATKVLDQTTDRLKTQNTESMQTLTEPLKQNLEQLQQAIRTTNSETAKQTASLSEQLRAMAEQTSQINQTATRLTNVMRGGNKIQGNWGEMTLKNLLESQGLQLGRDFDLQQTLTDEHGKPLYSDSGSRMMPDAILHYPNNEDVIIDAKMSIDAYAKYVETEDETQRRQLVKDVVRSIREQINRLAEKDYNQYVKTPRKSVDFVIMYVPYEGALQLALAAEPSLWNEAFKKKVFITGQQNLMAILTMIHAAWRQYLQSENEKQVYVLAEELLKRVGHFLKHFDTLKMHLHQATVDCEELESKYNGRMGIVQKANQLKKLGVKENIKYPIPSDDEDLALLEAESGC